MTGATEANKKLVEGWTLMAVVPSANSSGQPHMVYVLGKPATKEPGGFAAA